MGRYTLENVVWGSKEFHEVMKQARREEKVNNEIELIDELLIRLETDEGWDYLVESIKE